MVRRESLPSTPEDLTAEVNRSFLNEDQPLSEQGARLNDCLFLIYDRLGGLRAVGDWTNLEVSVSAQRLREGGFVSTEQEDHLTLADKVSLKASFEQNGVLTLEERYFRTDPAVHGDIQLNLHRDMLKIFRITRGKRGFRISLNSASSLQTRLAVFTESEDLPKAYREVSNMQFSTDEAMEYPTSEITPKDINRLLFILFSGLFYGPLHPPSSLVKNGN